MPTPVRNADDSLGIGPLAGRSPFRIARSLAALVHAENSIYSTQGDLDFRVGTASRAGWQVFGVRLE
jgi:hypothetical protein